MKVTVAPRYLLVAVLTGLVAFDAWLGTCGFDGCPSKAEVQAYRPDEGGRILDRAGRTIGHLAFVRRIDVPIGRVPKTVQQAFVATEDRRFYSHHGLDWRGVARATVRNLSAMHVREGFSTIDMQVARNTFLANRYDGRSFKRKLLELRYAGILERDLTKNQILDLYLNAIYLGDGVYGVEAASRDLFGKHVWQLSLSEGAMLAALPKGPSSYTPRHDEDRARTRRNLVLGLMADQGYISRERAEDAQDESLDIADDGWRPDERDASTVVSAVRAAVDSLLPKGGRTGDLTVRTTLDWPLQRAADRVIPRQAQAIEQETENEYGSAPGPAQGAFVALDAATGDVRAMVTGTEVTRGGFNRATDAHRQPGSAFKPFVYTAALQAGLSPATMVQDEPVDIDMNGRMWSPANFNDEYTGAVTFRRALMISSNAAAVRVSHGIGERRVIAAARSNGVVSKLQPVPAIALGAFEVTPLELVTAYAPFANGGLRVTPRLVTEIDAPGGHVLWKSRVHGTERAMDPRDAYEMTSMLQGVVNFGTGRVVRNMGVTGAVAGKTGTTNNNADVWFVGYTPTLVAGVWFGYDTPTPIGHAATGGRLAAPAWASIMRAAWREPANSTWMPPANMVPAVIDPESGQLAGEWCPQRKTEWFKPGSAPTDTCGMHTGPQMPTIAEGLSDFVQSVARGLRRIIRF